MIQDTGALSNNGPKQRPLGLVGNRGQCDNIKVIRKVKCFHISGFHPETTPCAIIEFIESNLCKPKHSTGATCYLLNHDKQLRRFINFKICVPFELTSTIYDSNFWPSGVTIRPFVRISKNL